SSAKPMPVDAALANANGLGSFFIGHAAKKFEQHHARAFGMHPFEFLERTINEKNLLIRRSSGEIEVVNIEALLIASALYPRFVARVINQNPAHRLGYGAEKISPVIP